MSSSPGLEHSAPPTPSTPAFRGDLNQPVYQVTPQATSTPSSRDHSTHKSQKHRPALQVVLPPASGNFIGHGDVGTPPPRSPAALSTGEPSPRHPAPDGTSSDKSSETAGVGTAGVTGGSASRLSRAESYKQQRQRYRREKKRAATALLCSIDDPAAVVLADWLKVRGSLKSWTKLWCMLKPGLLLLYKSNKAKSSHWVGTVLLNTCHVIERPSKKDGFCFKLYHPLEQSIWAPRGPSNETLLGAVVQPFPTTHLIFRAPSQAAGHCWLDGLELALKCSTAMLRCSGGTSPRFRAAEVTAVTLTDAPASLETHDTHETQWSRDDLEMHFRDHELEGEVTDSEESEASMAGGHPLTADVTVATPGIEDRIALIQRHIREFYTEDLHDDVGKSGELVEEIAEENKSLLWFLIKQVRPGMDLSKVVLPTFILEPRSFLDKLSDNYYHADILSSAVSCDSPYERFKLVVRWYMSGLYRKPRGLKKPYNPVLGEVFRCHWLHPATGTRTYYVSEQVSHHPPISAFYVSNRKEGFIIEGSLLAKSKFYGNSTSAILEGAARVHLLPRREVYTTSAPYAHCKGIVMGTLSMELGGKVTIGCDLTGYSAEIEFKLKSFLGGSESTNLISGRIRKGKDTIAHIDGYWDGRIDIKDKRTGDESVLLDVGVLKQQRLRRYLVRPDRQTAFESQRLWANVSRAINNEDQIAATEEKTVIEEAQRARAKTQGSAVWLATHFHRQSVSEATLLQADANSEGHVWLYNHRNPEAWSESEVLEWEEDFRVRSLRSDATRAVALRDTDDSDAITHAPTLRHTRPRHTHAHPGRAMQSSLLSIDSAIRDQTEAIKSLQKTVERMDEGSRHRHRRASNAPPLQMTQVLYGLGLAVFVQILFYWMFY